MLLQTANKVTEFALVTSSMDNILKNAPRADYSCVCIDVKKDKKYRRDLGPLVGI
jgi:hypothetical protein